MVWKGYQALSPRDASSVSNTPASPVSPSTLRATPSLEESHPSPLFGKSIGELNHLFPDKEYDLPAQLVYLVNSIEELDEGLKTEGIFRVRPSGAELDLFKKKLEEGMYDWKSCVPPPSVHTPASLLKMLLRELAEPLIPNELYEKSVQVLSPQGAQEVYQALNPYTQKVVYFILQFLAKMLSPEIVEQSKMGIENLAMIFAPSFLRTPSLDLMLANAEREKSFVKNLFLAFPMIPKPDLNTRTLTPPASSSPSSSSSPLSASGSSISSLSSTKSSPSLNPSTKPIPTVPSKSGLAGVLKK